MKLYICANGFTSEQLDQALNCVASLEGMGHECSMASALSQKLYKDDGYVRFTVAESDLVVSLGGDGALLKAAATALKADRPLIGINAGRVGYLCAMKLEDIEHFNEKVASGRKVVCSLLQVDFEGKRFYALNDIVVSKTNFGKTVDLCVYADENKLFQVRGDAVIVSTPTGSTAYNRSAGGPIIDENVRALCVTSVCANTQNYPHVVNDDRIIRVKVNHEDAGIYADSQFLGKFPDELLIAKADKTLILYK